MLLAFAGSRQGDWHRQHRLHVLEGWKESDHALIWGSILDVGRGTKTCINLTPDSALQMTPGTPIDLPLQATSHSAPCIAPVLTKFDV